MFWFKLKLINFIIYRRIKEYQSEHKEAETDITAYLSNPINAYLLTKRLTSDWVTLENIMSFDVGGRMSIAIPLINFQIL